MRKIHTVLRLHFEGGLSRREIATSQSISYGTVANYLRRAQTGGLCWPLPSGMGERELRENRKRNRRIEFLVNKN